MNNRKTSFIETSQRNALLSMYPVDMAFFLKLDHSTVDEDGVPFIKKKELLFEYCPATITQYALGHWNAYLSTHDETHRRIFLAQVQWLVQHKITIGESATGWPHRFSCSQVDSYCLSATTQSAALSVLLRAYQLTQEACYLTLASSVLRTFELDILDGGIAAPVGDKGIFFEDASAYPATHNLLGCLFALIGLFDYKNITRNSTSRSTH